MDYPPMFFVQASLLLPVGFDGSEQYFWICNGSCAAFYLDDFISDFTEQRAYAIWNGIAFLARSNIFCHSSKSFYSDSRKHYFMPLEHISVLIYQAGQGTMRPIPETSVATIWQSYSSTDTDKYGKEGLVFVLDKSAQKQIWNSIWT